MKWISSTFVSTYTARWYEQRHEISNNVVCATSKGTDQPAHTRSLIRAYARRLNILWIISYWATPFGVSMLKRRVPWWFQNMMYHYVLLSVHLILSISVPTYTVRWYEQRHEFSNNVVCATSKGSDQPAHMRSLIRAYASRLNILWILSFWPNIIWSFYA